MFDTLVQPRCTQIVLHSVMLTTPDEVKNSVKCVFIALVYHSDLTISVGGTHR